MTVDEKKESGKFVVGKKIEGEFREKSTFICFQLPVKREIQRNNDGT